MSPAQPPRPPGKGPGKPPQPSQPREPEHPAEKGPPPGKPQAAHQRPPGKYIEVRKGKSGTQDAMKEEEDAPITNVALPRSITQEQEQADLKQRLGRDELIDIDKRSSLVKVKDSVGEPTSSRRRSSGLWLLIVVVAIAAAAVLVEKFHILDALKH